MPFHSARTGIPMGIAGKPGTFERRSVLIEFYCEAVFAVFMCRLFDFPVAIPFHYPIFLDPKGPSINLDPFTPRFKSNCDVRFFQWIKFGQSWSCCSHILFPHLQFNLARSNSWNCALVRKGSKSGKSRMRNGEYPAATDFFNQSMASSGWLNRL